MSVLAINLPLAKVVKTKTDKGKQPDRGTRRTREEDPDNELITMTKKHKLAKRISKAIFTDTEDEDGPPARPTIFVKPSKGVVPVIPAPSNSKASTSVKSLPMYLLTASQDVTKEVKKVRLAITEPRIYQLMEKDKGKEKAVAVKEPELYDLPCTKCSDEHKCVIAYGIRGLLVKACGRCFTLKATPVSKSKLALRMTRATSCIRPPMPVVEYEDTMDDADVAIAAHEDVKMSHEADAKQPIHIAAMTPMEPKVDHMPAVASADDFPTDHWQEDPDSIVMPLPSPPYFSSPPPHLTKPTILDAESMVHD
ncbi:hypothetical protein BDR04DRAFT_1160145 [Suillus decipiens]|nr:hypothetical protein BDR04DRAFT_1160145 [Suillus decipiens]